jgi:hypothetical protein
MQLIRITYILSFILFLSSPLLAQQLKADTVEISPRSSWDAQEARPYKQHVPVQITVHHEGGKLLLPTDDARQRLKNIQTWGMGPDRQWTDIPYHLLIAADGTVYEGRSPFTVGETNTEYDPTGHLLICFLGNYNQQQLDEKLLAVLIRLLADSCRKYDISPDEISTHRDHSKQTTCPGDDIYSYFENGYIVEEVKKLMADDSRRYQVNK